MAKENRLNNRKGQRRTPYSGFENPIKRDAKGHFVKQDNGFCKKDKKPNAGYNCYKNAKPSRANGDSVKHHDANLAGVAEICDYMNRVLADVVGSIGIESYNYENKPVYSRAEMDLAIVKTRNEVHEYVRKNFKTAFWNGVVVGASSVFAIGIPVCLFWQSIVNFAKSLFA